MCVAEGKLEALLIFLDFEKAFDRCSWDYSQLWALRNCNVKKTRRELSRAELRNRAVHCPRARNLALLSPELGLFGLRFGLVRWLRRPT